MTRFLLKETTNQLHSLQSSLECAMETTAEQTRQEKYDRQQELVSLNTISIISSTVRTTSGLHSTFFFFFFGQAVVLLLFGLKYVAAETKFESFMFEYMAKFFNNSL